MKNLPFIFMFTSFVFVEWADARNHRKPRSAELMTSHSIPMLGLFCASVDNFRKPFQNLFKTF